MSRKALIFAFALFAARPAWAFQNEPGGFRGLAWGTPIGKVAAQMQLTERNGVESIYARSGDKLAIGAAQLDYIRYLFRDGALAAVLVVTLEGDANKRALLDALSTRFGEPGSSDTLLGRYYWVGKRTRIGVHCGLRPNCELFMQSERSAEAEQAARGAAAKAAGKDF